MVVCSAVSVKLAASPGSAAVASSETRRGRQSELAGELALAESHVPSTGFPGAGFRSWGDAAEKVAKIAKATRQRDAEFSRDDYDA